MSGNSIFIARLIGPVLLVVGIALLLNRAAFRAMAEEVLRSRGMLYLSGILTMLAGVAIVITHNRWALGWAVLITILGWLMAIGGAVRILFPDRVEAMGRRFLAYPMGLCIAGGIWLALGIVFCIFGYITN